MIPYPLVSAQLLRATQLLPLRTRRHTDGADLSIDTKANLRGLRTEFVSTTA